MAIVYEKLLALKIPEVEHSYGPKDCILYALGLGLGQDPMNEDELAFVYEKNLKALPTFALVQGYSAVLAAQSRQRRELDQGRAWRAGLRAARAGRAARHRRSASTRIVEVDRQRRGQRRAGLFRARDHRQGDRRAARDAEADHLLPRRRRLRRSASAKRRRRMRSPSARRI